MTYIEPEMIVIQGGCFWMGNNDGPSIESPRHRVRLSTFQMARYPVTRTEFQAFIDATDLPPPPWWDEPAFQGDRKPAIGINWIEANDYCKWLSEVSGGCYRLPTEAERECAARGGADDVVYPWGDALPQSHRGGRHQPVEEVGRQDGPNGFGLFDISGGVHEWCADFFGSDYYMISPEKNPGGPATGDRRVARGGAWRHAVRYARCAARSSLPPEKRFSDFGFRCAATDAQMSTQESAHDRSSIQEI